MTVQLHLEDIVVPDNRRPLRGVAELAASIQEIGLLNPITVTTDCRLVAGYHRLEALRRLGRNRIPATVLNLDALDAELAEIDENLIRNDLDCLDRCEHLKRRKVLYEAKYPPARKPKGGRPRKNREIISSFSVDTADKVRVTQRTVQHEVQIAERLVDDVRDALRGTCVADSKTDLLRLAKMPAERQRAVTGRITSGEARGVKEAARQLDRHEQCEAVRNYTPPEGRFSVIAADPPWPYSCRTEDVSHRGAIPYPSMTVEDICNLKLPADRDCVLWLWTTNAFMRQAFQVLDAWAFQDKTILTWVKDRMGVGNWLRGQTEHCILAVKGSPVVTLQGQSTVLNAPVREHSRKPDAFYALVEAICPARARLDLFGRERRTGWVCAGAEAAKFDP